ncbi:MAG: endonuclease, partial [Candidatus Marinimicrobia bacterium]|nr:endonuclease [Candidatus Neomarinimicrobiota bacterium]
MIYQSLIIALILSSALADEPAGYYNSAEGLIETALQQALHDIIDNHTSVSYTSLWTHFQSTDRKSNGKVWDMYSDIPGGTPPYEYTFVSDQCGNYSAEGDCYNREHSWPKSWFNENSPMNTDLFHLYPTDGYVNGRRGNYPYGEVGTAT